MPSPTRTRTQVPVPCSARGNKLGQFHPRAAHSDAVVAAVRELRALGCPRRRIADATGISPHTLHSWALGRRRHTKPARHIVMRVRDRSMDSESPAEQALARLVAEMRNPACTNNPEEDLA